MLEVQRLKQGYGNSVVFQDLSLTLEAGVHALLGPNGAGKSTLLRTVATILPPRAGSVTLDGIRLTRKTLDEFRSRLGYLPQRFGFDPAMTVEEFVCYAAWSRGVAPGRRRAAVAATLERVNLGRERGTPMRRLSGGMTQRAGIGWAIVGDPQLILLDEPTVGLDPMQRIDFRRIIGEQKGSVIMLSTHMTGDAEAMADSVIVIDDGRVPFQGTATELAGHATADCPGSTGLERGYAALVGGTKES